MRFDRFVCKSFLLLFVFTVLLLNAASAQVLKGSLSGKVTDERGGVLQGARVELEPKAQVAVTDSLGLFTITDLAPGSYTVKVSYVGFEIFSNTVNVTAGQ